MVRTKESPEAQRERQISFGTVFRFKEGEKGDWVVVDTFNQFNDAHFSASQVIRDSNNGLERLGLPGTHLPESIGEIRGQWSTSRILRGLSRTLKGLTPELTQLITSCSQKPSRRLPKV